MHDIDTSNVQRDEEHVRLRGTEIKDTADISADQILLSRNSEKFLSTANYEHTLS